MRAVAYCRVSTNKEEQLESLESQQKFFAEYAQKHDIDLIRIYADEGKSGTKLQNRTELLRLLSDAQYGLFDLVLIKDVSRLARNTVDFLTSLRKLSDMNVKLKFVNYDFTTENSSEFVLTMLSAIAQEESANTSKRIKFGKKQNAEKGRVPNFVYGYDKIPGDIFNMAINENEAQVVRRIFRLYTEEQYGANRIAAILNNEGILTKRGCKWSQNAIARILTNEVYIGKIINSKQEVVNYLTGKRKKNDEEQWHVVERPDLSIVDEEIFYRAKRILESRSDIFKRTGERTSNRYVFSKLIHCSCCNHVFRRITRTYTNTYVSWVCSGRNMNGADTCPNKTVLKEEVLLQTIRDYFTQILEDQPNVISHIINEFNRQYKTKDENIASETVLKARLAKLKKTKTNYIDMYNNEIITMEELKEKAKEINTEQERIERELKFISLNIRKSDMLKSLLERTFKDIECILNNQEITHAMLSRVVEKIVVNEEGQVDIYFKLYNELGLDNTVQLIYNNT